MKNMFLKKGFTLTEVIIVLAIFSLMAGAAALSLNGARNRVILDEAQATLISAFEKARSRAVTGVGTSSHGVYLEEDRIVFFEGSQYSGQGEVIPFSVFIDASNSTVIFNRLSGNSTDEEIILRRAGEERIIIINENGVIGTENSQ